MIIHSRKKDAAPVRPKNARAVDPIVPQEPRKQYKIVSAFKQTPIEREEEVEEDFDEFEEE